MYLDVSLEVQFQVQFGGLWSMPRKIAVVASVCFLLGLSVCLFYALLLVVVP